MSELSHGIKLRDKIGYAMGDMGGVLTFSLVNAFLQMFYTDVLHIELGKITVLMIVARIWDAVNDPMWGSFIDSRKPTKFGRFRPYILWGSFPLALGAVLMFTKLPGLSENQYLIYAYVTYIFYGMMYTAVNIPYGSLASAVTDDELERSSLSMWRSIGAGLGGLPSQILLPLLVYSKIQGSDQKYLDGSKMFLGVLVLAVVSVLIFAGHFKFTKERISVSEQQREEKFNAAKAMKTLFRNRPFVVLCLISMCLIAFQMYTQTIYNYLFKNFFGKPGLYSLVTVCTYLPMAVFLPIMTKLIRRFGKKELCAAGMIFAAAVNLVMFLIGFTEFQANPYVFLTLVLFSGFGQTFLVLEVWALVTDVIDYHEYLSHRREEGISYAVYSFVRKIGQTLAGAGAPALLAAIGYDVNAVAGQSTEVLDRLYSISTAVPAIILFALFILLKFAYPLGKEQLAELHCKLEAVRNGGKSNV